jgi:hypothetical protein
MSLLETLPAVNVDHVIKKIGSTATDRNVLQIK